MAAVNPLSTLALTSAQALPPVAPTASPTAIDGSATRFRDTLAQALDAQAQLNGSPALDGSAQVNGVAAPVDADAQARARSTLELEGQAPAATGDGDAVLNGLQRIRGVFDQQLSSFAASTANIGSSETMFKAQVAAANFSLFMEVGSKLAGKASQSFESLLKGQ